MGINLNHSSCYSPQSNSHAERFVRSCKDIMQKNKHLTQLELDEYMLCINSQIQPEGQHSAVDRFLGRSVLNFIPNSFNDQFVWQDTIKARAEVREKRVNKKCYSTTSAENGTSLEKFLKLEKHHAGKFSVMKY